MADDLSGFSMLELFRLEAESQTAVLSAGVLAIEELERSPQTVESMMRAAHSLKGAARIVGLDPAVRVAHSLEDVFVAAGKGTVRVQPRHADRLLGGVDFLSSISKADDALEPTSDWAARGGPSRRGPAEPPGVLPRPRGAAAAACATASAPGGCPRRRA